MKGARNGCLCVMWYSSCISTATRCGSLSLLQKKFGLMRRSQRFMSLLNMTPAVGIVCTYEMLRHCRTVPMKEYCFVACQTAFARLAAFFSGGTNSLAISSAVTFALIFREPFGVGGATGPFLGSVFAGTTA